jgi:hypothetical protein
MISDFTAIAPTTTVSVRSPHLALYGVLVVLEVAAERPVEHLDAP